MTGHDEIRELLAPVALGAATPDEEALVDHHAEGCHECAAALARMRAGASAIALSVPQVDPPPGLKRSIMDVVEHEAALRTPRPAAPSARESRGWRRLLPGHAGLWPVLAAGLAVLLAVMVVWNAGRRGDGGAPSRVPVVATAQGVGGEATVLSGGDTAVLRMSGLPALPPGRGYEVWVLRDGAAPESAGFMTAASGGDVVAVADGLDGATALAVTPERLTDTAAPTSTPFATVDLRSG